MFSRQEHHQGDDQVICWNCEEAVHETASVCPYCNVDLSRHTVQKAVDLNKITILPQGKVVCEQPSEGNTQQSLRFLGSLFFLLAGSSLFFIAILIAFFSRGGAFTISWPEHSWSAFFGLGLSLLAFGTLLFQKLPSHLEE